MVCTLQLPWKLQSLPSDTLPSIRGSGMLVPQGHIIVRRMQVILFSSADGFFKLLGAPFLQTGWMFPPRPREEEGFPTVSCGIFFPLLLDGSMWKEAYKEDFLGCLWVLRILCWIVWGSYYSTCRLSSWECVLRQFGLTGHHHFYCVLTLFKTITWRHSDRNKDKDLCIQAMMREKLA